MNRLNLSEWSLRNRGLVLYIMVLLAVVGAASFLKLSQSEDPPFTFKVMVVRTLWPGASAEQVGRQITERIERKIMETGEYMYVRSYSRPGESQVFFMAADHMRSGDLPGLFYQIRKKVGDIRHTLPEEIVGPFFNDEFGDTFGNIYALIGPDFDYATLKDYADRLQLELQRVPDVSKVELVGLQDEKIWIELSNTKLATIGVPLLEVQQAINAQNAMLGAGFFETADERVRVRISGHFDSIEAIRAFPLRIGDRDFKLGDVAEVQRGFSDPPAPKMRHLGQDALGLAVAMQKGGNIVELGRHLDSEFARLQQTLPLGMTLERVADQPRAVRTGVGEFVRVLAEAVIIVLVVSFLSLGARSGLVVALSVPLVLAMTFAAMALLDIGLHKISLGALVLALGLLVDDAIIAVEMMAVKMEQGLDRIEAAAFMWKATAFPMLTGTLITAAGFLPIVTAASSTGEYTRSISQVVTIALLLSWVAAVVFVPYLGYRFLPGHSFDKGEASYDPYQTRFYRHVRSWIASCLHRRRLVIALTLFAFVVSIGLFRFVPQQFFPASGRLELLVDMQLEEGASLRANDAQVRRLEALLAERQGDQIESFTAFVGSGTPRFYLPLDQQLPAANFSQFLIVTRDIDAREAVREWLIGRLDTEFSGIQARVTRLENGPPVGYPVQFRVSGEHVDAVLAIAERLADKVRAHPETRNTNLDWRGQSKLVRLDIDQARARALGVNSAQVARFLQSSLSGTHVSTYREDNELIEILLRGPEEERTRLSLLSSLAVPTEHGGTVPLSQLARLEYAFERGVIWHRDRLPTVTVRADIYSDALPAVVAAQIEPHLAEIRAALPIGYRLEVGGTVEDSARAQASVRTGLPLLAVAVLSLLMIQLRSFPRTLMVVLTAPLGLIGVVLFLMVFRVPFGFVAMLGTIALSGMIMRNAVILVDQIEQDISAGSAPWDAVIEATVRRFRPIVLTAMTAVLAMIPLSRSIFFGPMAVSIMGGLTIATALTLLFVPALYVTWFRVRPPA